MGLPNDKTENKHIHHLSIPIHIEYEECLKKIYPGRLPPDTAILKKIVDEAENLVDPQSLYRMAWVGSVRTVEVMIDKIRFRGSLLPEKLHKSCIVFPYILTLGQRLDHRITAAADSLLEQYYFDQIGNILLRQCSTFLESHLKKSYTIKQLSSISPGSLIDWPIEEQKSLFSLFGDTQKLIGVHLTSQMLMIPKKSLSGIFFPSQEKFVACSLCPRKDCQERSVPFKF